MKYQSLQVLSKNQKLSEKLILEATNKTNVRKLNEISYFVSEKINVSKITPKNHVGVHNLLPDKQGKKDLSEHVPIKGFLTYYRRGDILIGKIGAYLRKI